MGAATSGGGAGGGGAGGAGAGGAGVGGAGSGGAGGAPRVVNVFSVDTARLPASSTDMVL